MTRACASCDRPLRKGSARRAWILDAHGDILSGLVCSRCADRSVAIVVPPATTIAPACSRCKREPASVCASCAARVGAHARELAIANVTLAARRESDHQGPDVESLDYEGELT